jgi:tetratricopeptide (TPR) repeat protein
MFSGIKRLLVRGATKLSEKNAKAAPNDFFALLTYGKGLGKLKRYDEAIEVLERAIRLNPKSGEAFSCLGATYGFVGLREKQIAACERAVELQPNGITYGTLAGAYAAVERYYDSAQAAKNAVKLAPDLPEAHLAFGVASAQTGDVKNALNCWNTLKKLDPILALKLEGFLNASQFGNPWSRVQEKSHYQGKDWTADEVQIRQESGFIEVPHSTTDTIECISCNQKLRVPHNRKRILIYCPTCGRSFIRERSGQLVHRENDFEKSAEVPAEGLRTRLAIAVPDAASRTRLLHYYRTKHPSESEAEILMRILEDYERDNR